MSYEVAFANRGSAAGQSLCQADAESAVDQFVRCAQRLEPLLRADVVRFLTPLDLDNAELVAGEPLSKTIGNLRNRDTRRLWYIYTRNRGTRVEDVAVEIILRRAELSKLRLNALSFGGCPQFQARHFELELPDSSLVPCVNIVEVDDWEICFGRYEESPKHAFEHQTAKGKASRMSLDQLEAQLALWLALPDETSMVRYGCREERFVAFRLTEQRDGRLVFHGYDIEDRDIPHSIKAELVRRGYC